MKFSKKFTGVRNGQVFPETFQPGDDCPPELADAAREMDALAEGESTDETLKGKEKKG